MTSAVSRVRSGAQTTFTTRGGECPLSDSLMCPDYCDGVQVCATLERGRCYYAAPGPFTTDPADQDVQRDLYCFTFRLQNCTKDDIKVTDVRLNLTNRLVALNFNDSPPSETLYTDAQFQSDPNDVTVSQDGDVRVLYIESTCGSINGNYDPYDTDEDNLLAGTTVLPPGECCIKVLIAVTYPFDVNTGAFQASDTLIERSCLSIRGFQNVGGACSCRFERSLLLPADCPLRLGRNTQAEASMSVSI